MPYVTSVERIVRWEASGDMVLRQLKRRFGDLAPALETRIKQLSTKQLEALGDALLDFADISELQIWLENQPLLEERW